MSEARIALDRLKSQSAQLSNGNSILSNYPVLTDGARSLEKEFDDVQLKVSQKQDALNQSAADEKSIMGIQREIDQWLTDTEIKLINLQPCASTMPAGQQINTLQNVLDDLRKRERDVHKVMEDSKLISVRSTAVHSTWVQELGSRYHQAIENCTSWILDLSVPRLEPSPPDSLDHF